jgi:hypothetical protein
MLRFLVSWGDCGAKLGVRDMTIADTFVVNAPGFSNS